MDVVLPQEGLPPIQAAAPGHVAAVRETFPNRDSSTATAPCVERADPRP